MRKKRRPGEKPQRKSKLLKLPQFPDPREPARLSPLAQFLTSLEGEGIDPGEAIREFQEDWCDHSKSKAKLVATEQNPGEDDFRYIRGCGECGKLFHKKGRPPQWLRKQ